LNLFPPAVDKATGGCSMSYVCRVAPALAAAFALNAFATPTASAAPIGNSTCKRELAAAEASLRKTLVRLLQVEKAGQDEKCTALREHAGVAGKARDVFSRCAIGRDRDVDVGQMDAELLRAKFVIGRDCPKDRQTKTPIHRVKTERQP